MCVEACPDVDCWSECDHFATGAAKLEFDSILGCGLDNGCPQSEHFGMCLAENCDLTGCQ